MKIIISAGDVSLPAELNDSPTARQIWETLPIEGTAKTWGDEVYFEIPVVAGQGPDARAEVEVGELGSAESHYNEFGKKRIKRQIKKRIVTPGTRFVYSMSWMLWKQD